MIGNVQKTVLHDVTDFVKCDILKIVRQDYTCIQKSKDVELDNDFEFVCDSLELHFRILNFPFRWIYKVKFSCFPYPLAFPPILKKFLFC